MADHSIDNDPDLTLAIKIGLAREQGSSLSELDDSLIQELIEYKKEKYRPSELDSSEKQVVWNYIKSATRPTKTPVTKLFSSVTMRWAVAAILLVGAVFSFIHVLFYQQSTLLAASESAIKTVQLGDGSSITLRPYSELYRISSENSSQVYRLHGEGYFNIIPNLNRTFTVKTETGKVSVLGTQFTLSTWGSQMQVYLKEGSVKVEALKQDSAVIIKPGELASVSGKDAVPVVTRAQPEEALDWIDQQLIFKDKPAEQIIRELEQQFDITITLPPEIVGTTLTGQLSLENLQTLLGDLELVFGGKFVQTADRSYTFEKN